MPESSVFTDRARRGAGTALLAAAGLGVHLAVQRLAPAPVVRAGDGVVGLLPFLPWTVWIYLLFFPLLVFAGALQPGRSWLRLAAAWSLGSLTAWALVLLVPVTFARPDLATLDPLHRWALARVYGLDAAHVTFPCLHSALTWISWVALRDRGPRLRSALFVLAVAITLSTMTTRQHSATDNAAGLAIAWACARTVLPARSGAGADREQEPEPAGSEAAIESEPAAPKSS